MTMGVLFKMETTIAPQIESEIKLNSTPQLIHSPYLSQMSNTNTSLLSYNGLPTGTHKWHKALRTMSDAKYKGNKTILFINPYVEKRDDSNGSGIDALELACALYYPEAQVVSVVHDSRALWKEAVHSDFPNSRPRINLGLDLESKFYKPRELENHFKDLIKGRVKVQGRNAFDFNVARNFLYSKGNPLNCIDGTNWGNIGGYGLSEDLIEKSKDFDYIIGSAGAGGRALDQITYLGDEKTKHIICVPNGHPLDPFHNYEKSTSPRVQTRFRGNTHLVLDEVAQKRNDVIFKSVGFFGGKKAKEVFFDNAVREDGLRIESSADGSIGLSVFKEVAEPNDKTDLRKGVRIFNTHQATPTGFEYKYNTMIPAGANVLFVDTGVSDNLKLRELVESGL